jgi:hypothetical protein
MWNQLLVGSQMEGINKWWLVERSLSLSRNAPLSLPLSLLADDWHPTRECNHIQKHTHTNTHTQQTLNTKYTITQQDSATTYRNTHSRR